MLFKNPARSFRVIQAELWDQDDDRGCELRPLDGKTLAKDYVDGPFEGRFIVAGQIIRSVGEVEDCYLEIVLPERICEYRHVLVNGYVVRLRGRRTENGTAIPSIGIEAFGVPQLYYASENPNSGIAVLSEALSLAKEKRYVAYDLAVLLRKQKRYKESIEAFTIVLAEEQNSPIAQTAYKERSLLYTALGQYELAAKDRQSWSLTFEQIYGRAPVSQELF